MKIFLSAIALPVLVFAVLFSVGATPAQACSVMEGWPPPAPELAAQTDAVFAGSVTSIIQDKSIYGDYRVTFKVEESLKGSVGETVTLKAPGSSAACGYDDGYGTFTEGSAWIIYASGDDDGFTTNAITGNTKYKSVAEAVTALRAIKDEMDADADTVPQEDLWIGKQGASVTWLQEKLIVENVGEKARALASIGATGYFGTYTQAALAEYQVAHKVTPAQGYYGAKTRAALLATSADDVPGSNTIPQNGRISLEGTTTCLPPKNTDGPVIAMCALGFEAYDGNFFALNYENLEEVGSTEGRVRVEGTFERKEHDTWKQVGIITVTKIVELD